MQNFGKRTGTGFGGIDTKSSGTCFSGCLVVCSGKCDCKSLNPGVTAADGEDGGKTTSVWGRNYVNLSGD